MVNRTGLLGGPIQNQVLSWIETVHGYLSSPTGGGVKHGADVAALQQLQLHEARLFCNLIRSYINYLMDEHSRLVGRQVLPVR